MFWTGIFGADTFSEYFPADKNCPYDCIYTSDRSLQAIASARVFHARDFNASDLSVDNPDAYNVFFVLESPTNTYFLTPPSNTSNSLDVYFNITITYRSSNADVYYPYDAFIKLDGNEDEKERWTTEQVKIGGVVCRIPKTELLFDCVVAI